MAPNEILSKPYVRQVVPQPDGVFKAEILEFPGCFAIGDTAANALANLEEVAIDWIAATIAQGQDVPEPTESADYSGKFVQRMSKSLHRKATQFALRDGVSLNQFIVNCVAEHVGMLARPTIYAHTPNVSHNFTLQVAFASSSVAPASESGLFQKAETPTGATQVPHTMRFRGAAHA